MRLETFDEIRLRPRKSAPVKLPQMWRNFLGRWEMPSYMTVWGPPGGGKSTFVTKFSADLDKLGYRCVFLSIEEDATRLIDRCERLRLRPNYITILNRPKDLSEVLEILKKHANEIDVIVVDSFNTFRVEWEELQKLWGLYPNISWIYVLHSLKSGKQFKGNNDIAHDPDVVIKVKNGKAETQKNRFGPTQTTLSI
jgi:predicted ATP-dependent serine protease